MYVNVRPLSLLPINALRTHNTYKEMLELVSDEDISLTMPLTNYNREVSTVVTFTGIYVKLYVNVRPLHF